MLMSRNLLLQKAAAYTLVACSTFLFAFPAFAVNEWNNNNSFGTVGSGPVTTNWATTARWSAGSVPASGQGDINITNVFLQDTTITNASGTGLNYLRIISGNGASSSNLTIITSGAISSTFGLRLGNKATLILNGNNSTLGSNANQSFDLTSGTLILSNGASLFLNFNAASQNDGTIQLTAASGLTDDLNYAQNGGRFLNNSIIIKNGVGTGNFTGNFGANNFAFENSGTIIINAGTMRINSADAFTNSGFSNRVSGVVIVNTNGLLIIQRSSNSWNNGGDAKNAGVFILNGGSVTAQDDGGINVTRTLANFGTIQGNGTLAIAVFNTSNSGFVVASNGTLVVGQVFGNNGTWLAKSGGTMLISSNTDLGGGVMSNGVGGTWRIGQGGGGLANTLTVSTSFLNSDGTILLGNTSGGGSTFTFANTAAIDGRTFTNSSTGVITGRGTLQFGFGSGQNNAGVINNGTILAISGGAGSMTIYTGNTFNGPLSNSTSGTIVVSNGTTFAIRRDTTAWNGATLDSQQVMNSGTILLNDGTFVTQDGSGASSTRLVINAGTIIAQGTGTATNTWRAQLENRGTLLVTNNGAVFNLLSTTGMLNTATGRITIGGVNAVATFQGTNIGQNGNSLVNLGTITGQGTITLGVTNSVGGANGNLVNNGSIIATNFGSAAAGTLFISTGNAFSNGGFSNGASGNILIASNTTLTINRSQNAWSGSGNSIANLGTISLQGGVLNLASDGIVSNAASFLNIGNGLIQGWGTIDSVVIQTNGGRLFANATNLTSVGTLTVRTASTTNNATSTLGTIGTNSILNLVEPGGQTVLINLGTISLSGGTILFNGGSGTITNFNIIAGVGDVSTFPIVNAGAAASFIAQAPISGLSNLVANVGVTNTGLLGANNTLGGAATLQLSVSGGAGLVNNGTIAAQGGFVTVGSVVTNLTGLIYGNTNQTLAIANLTGGRIMASNGVFGVGLQNDLNQGVISNFNATSTVLLTNTVLVNTGTIALNSGGFRMSGSVVTNQGSITGPGDFAPALWNDTNGVVLATNGTLNVSTNTPLAGEQVMNLGTFNIANASTLNVVPAWLNTNGTVNVGNTGGGGNLVGGTITNKGTITGQGTITSVILNQAAGTIKASNGVLRIDSTGFTSNDGTLIGGTAAGAFLQITNIPSPFLNNGTMIADGSGNLAFYILQILTNTTTGVIRGAGIVRAADNVVGGSGVNFNIVNQGLIQATNGTLIVDSGAGFGAGFNNAAGATVNVASASTFGIARSTNAWLNSGAPAVNNGVIVLAGGTIAAFTNSGIGTAATPVQLGTGNSVATLSNAVGGVISGAGSINPQLLNLGTVVATNGTLIVANTASLTMSGTFQVQNGATLDLRANSGTLFVSGQTELFGGSIFATNGITQVRITATGSVTGFGQLMTSTNNGTAGGEEIIISGGSVIATNGTLYFNSGNAFANGGLSNSANGEIRVANGATFTMNRSVNAWNTSGANPANVGSINLFGGTFALASGGTNDSARFIVNSGRIFGSGTFFGGVTNTGSIIATNGTLTIDQSGLFSQTGTLAMETGGTLVLTNSTGAISTSFTNGGAIVMRGGGLQAGVIANTNTIFGFGTISGGGVANSGAVLASNGTLTVSLASFTNGSTATLGTLSTNATLDATIPGGAGQPLINQGTIALAGGTLLFNGLGTGTITNQSTGTIKGVGNVTQTVVNNGTVLAANPVSGLNVFSVGLSDLNSATIGASNGAVLNVVLGGGAQTTFNNGGSISMLGGTLIISNGLPGTITNLASAFVSGVGTVQPNIVNLGTVQATVAGGILDVALLGGTNSVGGQVRAGSGATLVVENPWLVNLGTIGAVGSSGGTIALGSSSGVITNRATINGFGGLAINNFVQNDAVGIISATNGVLVFNSVDGLANAGTIDIQNSGTLQSNSSNSWANANYINMRGGTLRTGGFTNTATSAVFSNTGTINGFGTILGGGAYGGSGAGFDKSFANLGYLIATNPNSSAAATLTIDTGGATTGGGIQNLGWMIIESNNTLNLVRSGVLPILNTGTITIHNGVLTGSSVLTNTGGGIIEGYGTLTHQIVNASGGTIRATNGLFVMTSSIFQTNFGVMAVANNATLQWNVSNAWVNAGTVNMRGGTLRTGGHTNVFFGDSFTNAAAGIIEGSGTIIGGGAYGLNAGQGVDKAIVNLGTVIASNGVLSLDTGFATANRGLANYGTMIVRSTNDTLALIRTAEITPTVTNLNYIYNSGTILINGGTLTANTSVTNAFESISLPGLIQGFGTVALTNELVNLGTIRSTNTLAGGDGILRFINSQAGDTDVVDIRQNGTLVVEGGSQMIFGTASNAVVVNGGTIIMNGGILRSGDLTNRFGSRFSGFGTITSVSIFNSGTGLATSVSAPLVLTGSVFNQTNGVLGASSGRLAMTSGAIFTNAGTVTFLNSVGTFSGQVFNKGAWIMDPSTNVFNATYTVASNGYITTTAGDVMMFKSNFVNQSRLSNQYSTHPGGEFIFNGSGGYTQAFYVAGIDLLGSNLVAIGTPSQTNAFGFLPATTSTVLGYSNNFAIGSLTIGSGVITSTLELIDTFGTIDSNDNHTAGLYVDYFTLNPGSLLIISNNVEFYFKYSNGVTGVSFGTLNPGDNVLILGSGSFHQITTIPEPSILMLLSAGAFVIRWYRRRNRAGRG